jgi:hypothetical protein
MKRFVADYAAKAKPVNDAAASTSGTK